MIQEAHDKGMFIRCAYDALLFTPEGLLDQLAGGGFCWTLQNWKPEERTPGSRPDFGKLTAVQAASDVKHLIDHYLRAKMEAGSTPGECVGYGLLLTDFFGRHPEYEFRRKA